ncbi:hypothetical protein L3Q82_019264 [Scortum barcoo]|uniref:Uncharacterized protein n=1 Tax=Scortum barcoo TaxID=214431 RepID=A0ACB8VCP1_9TELE|nr:hypothetical protein L3Q82_019264 [Scortum barcoo]
MPPGRLPREVFQACPTGRRPPGKTQDTLERLCLSAGLGTPRGPPGRAGGSVWGEGSLGISLLRLLPPQPGPGSSWLKMDGWMDGFDRVVKLCGPLQVMAVAVSRDLTVQVLEDVNAVKLNDRQQALRAAIQRGEPKSLGVSCVHGPGQVRCDVDAQELDIVDTLNCFPVDEERSVLCPPGPPVVHYDLLGLAGVQNKVSQVMLGLMVMSYSIPLHFTEFTEVVSLGVPWWSGLTFITAGVVAIVLDKHSNMKILWVCLIVSLVATVLSVVAVIIYSVDIDRNPEIPCIKMQHGSCNEKHYVTRLSRGLKSSLLLFTLAQTTISAIVCFLLFRQRHNFGQYAVRHQRFLLISKELISLLKVHQVLEDRHRLCVIGVLFLSVSGEKEGNKEGRSGTIQELRAALADLAGEGRTYLGRLAGEQTVLSVQKAFSQVLGVVAEGLAGGLNVLLEYVSHFLQTAGFQEIHLSLTKTDLSLTEIHLSLTKTDLSLTETPGLFPANTKLLPVLFLAVLFALLSTVGVNINKVTPDGLIFVVQWVVMALIAYWLLSLAFRLVASTLRRILWLFKVGVALACFGLILSDHSVGTETIAIRLAVLVCVCILLGIGTSRGPNAADRTAHLEEQMKVLERRLREMEKWKRTEE